MRGAKQRIPTDRLAADFAAGLNPTQIARKHGMSREAVRWRLNQWQPGCVARRFRHVQYERHVARYAKTRDRHRRRLERNRRILADVKAGLSYYEIGRRHGVSGKLVSYVAVQAGLPKRRVSSRQRDAEWLAIYEQGLTIKQVAAKVGRPESTVREGIVRARDGYVFRERAFNQ